MNPPTYCGASETTGHGSSATCGERHYTSIHQCDKCRIKDLEAGVGFVVTGPSLRELAERIALSSTGNCPCCTADDGWWQARSQEERVAIVQDMLIAAIGRPT